MIRLLIVDDDILIRESLKIIIGADQEIEVVGIAQHGKEALTFIEHTPIDIVLLDLRMPMMDGIEVLRYLNKKYFVQGSLKVLVLTTFDEDELVKEAISNGASGFLLKNSSPAKIISAIKSIALGNGVFEQEVISKLSFTKTTSHMKAYGLTTRELEIVQQIAKGLSNKEIAANLFISEGTVKNYITSILLKMQLSHRTQIAITYLG